MTASTTIVEAITKLRRNGRSLYSPSFIFHTSSAAISSAAESHSTSSSFQPPEKENRSRLSKWLLFLPGAITFGLGTWQIFRRQEKVKMLEYRQQRLGMEPLNCNSLSQPNEVDSLEFRKVICRGFFDENKSIYVGPRSRSISGVTENGYYVITPLLPIPNDPDSVQSPVLVNRGWVPRAWKDKALEVSHDVEQNMMKEMHNVQESERSSWWKFWTKKPKDIETLRDPVPAISHVEVTGIVRGSEKPSMFVPPNEPSANQWFYVDIPAIARTCGLPEDTIYIEDVSENVNASNPYPLSKDVNTLIRSSVMPQDHLNYTLTWYSLSAAVTFMAFKKLRPKRSRR